MLCLWYKYPSKYLKQQHEGQHQQHGHVVTPTPTKKNAHTEVGPPNPVDVEEEHCYQQHTCYLQVWHPSIRASGGGMVVVVGVARTKNKNPKKRGVYVTIQGEILVGSLWISENG